MYFLNTQKCELIYQVARVKPKNEKTGVGRVVSRDKESNGGGGQARLGGGWGG